MWYAIENNGEYAETLIKSGVPAITVEFSQPRSINAVAFPDKDLSQALQILGIAKDIYDIKKVATDNNNVELIVLKEKPAKEIIKSTHEREKELEQQFLAKKEEIKQSYLKECQSLPAIKEALPDQERSSLALEENAQALKNHLVERKNLSSHEKYSREFDLIENMDFVREIRMQDGAIQVKTRMITVKYGKTSMFIGRKKFTIYLDGNINISPLPHWRQHEHPCLGDIASDVLVLIRNRELAVVTKLLMDFVIKDEFESSLKSGSVPELQIEILRRKKTGTSLSGSFIRSIAKLFGRGSGARVNKNKLEFIQMCQRYDRQALSSLEYQIERNRRYLQEHFSRLVKRIQQDKQIREKLNEPKEKGKMLKILSDDYEKLIGLSDVSRVEAANGKIRVFTKTLAIETADGPYSLGRFCINIGLDGSLEIKNIIPSEYDHPIIWQGQPVFSGQMVVAIAKYIGRMEMANAVQIIIDSLKSFNQDEALVGLDVWEGGSHG